MSDRYQFSSETNAILVNAIMEIMQDPVNKAIFDKLTHSTFYVINEEPDLVERLSHASLA